ncbi:eukaryotic translation initiation factor 3 subunit J [Dendrobium catenatum]|uniref:eukaryotic translation initiation factor 3 subunit J n=1 Tax=Dendrobium catenatum TaxID=906689 RepID=UPI0009F2A6A1|nr:eukaryotic translation initiation factor 3 subunit J [Dendrobium catenatum]XP_020698538.1 eukaryotic translation initiation factor 3 subunit J [Dendrobium catenatum]
MADWDEEEFEPKVLGIKKEQTKGLWDDEDVDEEDVKESWEDEEDDTAKAPKKESVAEKKIVSKTTKDAGKKVKPSETKTIKEADVLADPVAEKLRQQRLVEEADYKSTTELFARKGDEKSLDNFIPKSENDFMEYAELLSQKIRSYEKSFHYIGLLKAVMRHSMTSLKTADAKEIASSVTAIANEKLKAEKEANVGKKKQGAKKKQLHVDKPDDDMVSATYDDAADDYDFM